MNIAVKNNPKFHQLPLPIVSAAIADAEAIASELSNPAQAELAKRNVLAVWAVKSYLEMLGYETDLTTSLCRDPVALLAGIYIADLSVKGLGTIECLAIDPEASHIAIPDTEGEDRSAYLLMEVEAGENYGANLLGFWKTLPQERSLNALAISNSHLEAPEELIEYFCYIQMDRKKASVINKTPAISRLSDWIRGRFEEGWGAIEEVIDANFGRGAIARRYGLARGSSSKKPSSSYAIGRAKVYDFGLRLDRQAVALVIEFNPAVNRQVDVRVRVCPMGDSEYLPPHLKLKVTLNPDSAESESEEVISRDRDNWIQLELDETLGNKFRVEVSLGDAIISEDFEI
ncbi:DUF1822 family protein [Merismopedia glauca]|uniref:DUF1822 domain-containing protein n=1 Tax=Merismopedia glauca CCAP 1448/3 TaxID=1296344 RepID=A0A2T1BYS2_9CYAN|nr:DUF1822 family protein [Merismopedia glauca]PSB01185.1 hypothetical protein C7B64_19655 [Merismopedia glauca CCAP 1448/3]